ncbi:MAG: hypothetical protein ACI8PZ_005037 [Myxococcota bacterium]|jgi:hypothetical protein
MTRMMTVALVAMMFSGCKALDKATDALDGGPQTSYCTGVCDWALHCHEQDRDLDADAVYQDCLDATYAADSDCGVADSKDGLPPEDSLAVSECTDAIDAKITANECGAFTGDEVAQKSGTAPQPACAGVGVDGQATFDAGREATLEGGEEMCDRFSTTWCERVSSCLLGDFELPQEAIDAVGTPQDICEARMEGVFTNSCRSNGLYDPPASLTDVNTARIAATSCIASVADVSCDDMFSGSLPPVCGAAFSGPDQLADFGIGLLGSACEFADFVPALPCN